MYYLARQASAASAELWRIDVSAGQRQRVLPGISVADFDISPDEREVAFTTKAAGGQTEVWLASVGRRSAPRRVIRAA